MSLFRKFLKSNPKDDGAFNQFARPNSVQTMGASLQRKFARGVQYNMKIVIRGDRNVGKTCLFERLQGQAFKEEYLPTDEIQVASIHWNHKTTDDVVKVEVWDIVDKGRKRKRTEGLKLENDIPILKKEEESSQTSEEPILDADFLDVYKGTHGVLMMLDMTKSWTLDYVERELPSVPQNIPVLILANHRDMGHHRTVSADQVKTFIESLGRPREAAQVRYTETSMRTAFGLKYIHRFFSLPFLQLQRETLLKQLDTNRRDITAVVDELETLEESEESNYDLFRSQLLANRGKVQGSAASTPTTPTDLPSPSSPQAGLPEKSHRLHAPPARPIPGMEAYLRGIAQSNSQQSGQAGAGPDDVAKSGASANDVKADEATSKQSSSHAVQPGLYKDRSLSKSSPAVSSQPHYSHEERQNVDDFMPVEESGGLSSFLDDAVEASAETLKSTHIVEDTSSDEDVGNPMVACFQEDLDSADEKAVAPSRVPAVASRHLEMSTDEDEDEDEDYEIAVKLSESVSRKSSSREASDLTVTSSTTPTNNVPHHREMSSSGYTSASSEKPLGRQAVQSNGPDVRAPPTTTVASYEGQGDIDSSDEEENSSKQKSKNAAKAVAKRKTSQPSTMEEENEDDIEVKAAAERPMPTIVLETSDFDFLERHGSASKASSSIDDQEVVTPAGSDVVEDHSASKKHSKKHRREKDGDATVDDQEKRKKKQKKRTPTADEDEVRKPRKKASSRHLNEPEDSVNGTSKKGKKKSKRKTTAPADDGFQLGGNSDLERFLNESNTSGGGSYEVL